MISSGLLHPTLITWGCLAIGTAGWAADPGFQRDVLPLLRSHCVRCHGADKQEAEIRLDDLSTNLIDDRAAAENWHEVLNVLDAGEMPPKDEPQLTAAQHATLTRWVSGAIKTALEAGRKTDGRVVLRRLNRVEYQNTMSDLLGLDMDYVRDLPPDAISPDGFRNDGRFLQMSALQLEYYLATARRALDRVIVSGEAPQVYDYEFTESKIDGWLGKPQLANRLGRQQEFLAKMKTDYPEAGEFLVRVAMTAELKPDRGYPLLEVSVGYRPDTQILLREFDLVEIKSPDRQTFEFRGRLENFPLPVRGQGKYPGLVVRVRNAYDDGTPLPKGKQENKKQLYPDEPQLPTLTIESVEFHGPVYKQWPPALHRRILFESPLRETNEGAYVAVVLKKFMARAYRRPIENSEVDRMVDFFNSIRPEFPTFEESMRETLAMVLIRPDFLYLLEPAGPEKRPIGDFELASRLSYFLWSTMPDERLVELAATGKLVEQETFSAEVGRMLNDPRSGRFVEQFTEQWLHLRRVDGVAVSRDIHPGFKDSLKEDMRGETQQFFAELLRHNLSAMNLLSSDFAMLNEPLAKHYGIGGVYGRTFQRHALQPDQHRGGLLGQASILLSNSTGADSHPIRRAVWIRDRLLNDPPAPPPPDVPSLEDGDPKFHQLSVREQLEIHRDKVACARCHRGIDPWGIALENFDAVGLWRDEIPRTGGKNAKAQPVKAIDRLPNGRELDGVDGLKEYLLNDQKDAFARSLVSRLLSYALGRRLQLSDQEAVDDIIGSLAGDEYRLRDLLQAVAASPPFGTK